MSSKNIAFLLLSLIGFLYLFSLSTKAQTIQTIYDTPPDIEACNAGVLKASEKQAVLDAVNAVRARHQLSPVVYDANYDNEAAQASLIVAANHFTIYNPSTSAKCYTPAGYAGASTSNLLFIPPSDRLNPPLFASSSDDIRTWLIDKDAPNLRHRRWLLDPFLRKIAYGRVEGATPGYPPNQWGRAATLKVYFEEEKPWELNDPGFIAYPFGDYPLDLFDLDWYWSFSVIVDRNDRENNQAVDYSKATIEVSNAEGNLTVDEIAYNTEKIAIPNVIQWKVPNAKVEQAYQVRIRNVRVRGNLRDYEYSVKVTEPYYRLDDIRVFENPKHAQVLKVTSGETFAIFSQPARQLERTPYIQTGSIQLQSYEYSPNVKVFQVQGAPDDELTVSFRTGESIIIRIKAAANTNLTANNNQTTTIQSGKIVSQTGQTSPNATDVPIYTVEVPPSPFIFKPKACTTLPTLANTTLARLVVPYAATTPQIFAIDSNAPYLNLLNDSSSTDSYPTWSPDGRKIAFLSQSHLFVMDADGNNRKQLSTLALDGSPPSWSPDGGWIAFSASPPDEKKIFRFVMAPPEIYIIQADGNNLRRMTADERWDTNPVWSPTGKSLVYTTNTLPPMAGGRNKPSTDLFIMNLLNGTKIAIHTPNRDISHPVWSPSGARLAFVTKPLTIPGDADGAEANEHIHLIDADGNNTRQLSPDDWRGALPTWSPDEEWLAFAVLPDLFDRSKNTSSAYMLRTDGTCGEQIVKAAIQTINAVVWSPYDSQIAIILQPPAIDTAKPEVIEPSTVTTTFTIFAANSLQTKVWAEQTAKLIGYAHVGRPTWSPLCALQNTNCHLPEPIAIDEFYQVSEEALDALAKKIPVIPQPRRPASAGDGAAPPPQTNQTSQQPTEAQDQPTPPVAFCLDENFDAVRGVCNRSQTLFTGQVKLIRVSWTPIPEFPNATFKRVWYLNGVPFLEREGTKTFAHIEVATRDSLATGRYRFELYVNGQLVQSGEFEVQ